MPAGIVCFFASYDYMDRFYQFLEENGTLKVIGVKKVVFREPRNSNRLDEMLLNYSRAAKGQGGCVSGESVCRSA